MGALRGSPELLVVRAEGELVLDAAADHRCELTGDRLDVRPFFRDVRGDKPGVLAPCTSSLIPAIGHVNLLGFASVRIESSAPVLNLGWRRSRPVSVRDFGCEWLHLPPERVANRREL